MNKQISTFLAALIAVSLIAGCGGGGGSSSTVPSAPGQSKVPAPPQTGPSENQKAKASFTVHIPSKTSSTAHKVKPKYVSPGTQSVAFSGSGFTTLVVPLTVASGNCAAPVGGTETCTGQAAIPTGSYTLNVQTFASTDGTGTPLSMNGVAVTINPNVVNNVSVTLDGVVNTFTVSLSQATVQIGGGSQNVTGTINAIDAAGYTIVGDSYFDASGNVISPTFVSSNPTDASVAPGADANVFTITYDGAAVASPTFTANFSGGNTFANATGTLIATAITNGFFTVAGAASLSGWTACSFPHAGLAAPVSAQPTPVVASPQPTATISAIPAAIIASPSANPSASPPINASTPGPLVQLATPPANMADTTNTPSYSSVTPPPTLGSNVVQLGDAGGEYKGDVGVCQQIAVPSGATQLRFSVYEGGTQYNFKTADQEADVLDSTGTTVQSTLFAELNCLWNPGTLGLANLNSSTSGCIPIADGGSGTYLNEDNGGFWKSQGPYNLSAYAGTTVTLFIGIFDYYTDAHPTPADANIMWVGNVTLTNT